MLYSFSEGEKKITTSRLIPTVAAAHTLLPGYWKTLLMGEGTQMFP